MTAIKRAYPRPLDLRGGRIDLTHGSGGRAMAQLIEELFEAHFDNPWLAQRNDQACFPVEAGRMVITTDGFVISPLFFPGGDIGSSPCTARSTTWRWPARGRSTSPAA